MDTRRTRTFISPASRCVLALLFALLPGAAFGAVGDINDGRQAEVPLEGWTEGRRLEVCNLAGRMTITGGDTPSLTVIFHAEKSAGLSEDEILRMVGVKVDTDGDEFKVTTDLPLERFTRYCYLVDDQGSVGGMAGTLGSWFGGSRSSSTFDGREVRVSTKRESGALAVWADYHLVVPAGREVKMDNLLGPLSVHNVGGEFTLDTGGGDVTVEAAYGELAADTGSGDVEVTRFEGRRLGLDTGSGDIRISRVRVEKLVADTGSGNVSLNGFAGGEFLVDTGSGDVTVVWGEGVFSRLRVDTGSGDVDVTIPPEVPFSLRADTGSGDVSGSPAGARRIMDDDELIGFERSSAPMITGPSIVVDTGSGDVQVTSR